MRAVAPTVLATANLIDSSIAENDFPTWVAGTSYALDAKVIKTDTHRIYRSLVASNAGNDPATNPTKWQNIGPTNRWAMLDQAVGTIASATGTITLTLAPGAVNALAVTDTNAETVRVVVTVDGATQYDKTQATNASGGVIDDWGDYFLAAVGKVSTLIFYDLPAYANCQVAVTITGPDAAGPVTVGTLLVGGLIDLGITEAGPTIGITDFSRKDTDAFGVTTVVERPWSKRMTARAMVDASAVDMIQRRFAALRAKPALYIGETGFDSLAVYGFYKDFSIDLATEAGSYVSVTIEGLTAN